MYNFHYSMVMQEKKVCDYAFWIIHGWQTNKLHYKVMSPTLSRLQSKIITQVKSEKLLGQKLVKTSVTSYEDRCGRWDIQRG